MRHDVADQCRLSGAGRGANDRHRLTGPHLVQRPRRHRLDHDPRKRLLRVQHRVAACAPRDGRRQQVRVKVRSQHARDVCGGDGYTRVMAAVDFGSPETLRRMPGRERLDAVRVHICSDRPVVVSGAGRPPACGLERAAGGALLGESQRTMYRLLQDGRLPGTAIQGGDIRIATVRLLAAYGLRVRRHAASTS